VLVRQEDELGLTRMGHLQGECPVERFALFAFLRMDGSKNA
jgi:hypothetical protein